MVSSKAGANKKKGAESGGQLLQELEALSQALYKGGSNASEHGRTRRDRRISEAGNVSNTPMIDEPIRGRHARHSISAIDPKKDLETREDEFPEWLEDNINFSKKLGAPAEKKNSLWNWKPFRALAHIGQQRNLCEFSAHVRAIDNLPASTNGLRLQVHLKHHEVATHTSPARVHLGSVEFEEILYVKCSVYGSKKSTGEIKYMAKSFTISVTAPDVDGLELGKHKIDLSRLLPETADDKATPDQWSTSFSLSGKAKGGSLMVTFGYEFVDKDTRRAGNSSMRLVPQNPFLSETRNFNSMPNSPHMKLKPSKSSMYSPAMSEPATDLSDYPIEHLSLEDEVVSIKSNPAKLNSKFNVFDQLDYSSLDTRNSSKLEKPLDSIHATGKEQQRKEAEVLFEEEEEDDEEGSDFVVVDQGVELSLLTENNTHLQHQGKDVEKEIEVDTVTQEMKVYTGTLQDIDNSEGMKEGSLSGQLEEMERTLNNLDQDIESMLKKGLDDESREIGIMPSANEQSTNSAINVDDEADQVAGEFLHMLEEGKETTSIPGSDSEPESPRALLLKQFEQEALLEGGLGLNISIPEGRETAIEDQAMLDETEISGGGTSSTGHYFDDPDDFELSEIMSAAETELQKAKQMMWSKARAKMLEDAETEALMQEWGLNEKVFQNVPPKSSSRLPGSFSDVMDITEPPPLAYGLGAVIPTNDGGLLRSMDPIHFVQSRNSSNLVMHVSKPIVVPVDMGSSALDILRKLAATGMDDLALHATHAMPLEDITGKSIHQIALEGQHVAHGQRYLTATETAGGNFKSITDGTLLNHRSSALKTSSGSVTEVMAKHATSGNKGEEFLSLDELAPMAMQQIEALAMEGLKIQADMAEEDAPYTVDALPWSDVSRLEGRTGENVIGSEADEQDNDSSLMSMGISLDEWMRLDAGVYDGLENNEKTLAILNVHNAAHKDIIVSKNKGEGSNTDQGGLMGDTLTLAMLVQLRDPLRNYEPVGAPMMALVQAERVMVPPRPKIWKTISFKGDNKDKEEIKQDDKGPQFKIVGVHMSGFKANEESKDNKNKIWANQKQQQSGSRWLLANGMSKTPKHSILKAKPGLQPTAAANKAESLWSISGRSPGAVTNRSYSRNPDVSFSKSSFRKQK